MKRTESGKNRWIVAGLAAVVCAGLALWVMNHPSDETMGSQAVQGSAASKAVQVAPNSAAPREPQFHDTWLLKPPVGAKVAVYEFDDLECPVCARWMPLVHAAAERHGVALVHRDYPLTEIHVWSFDAAVTARYIEDKVSPKLADEFRKDVFANQVQIANKDDLGQFTGRWFASHGLVRPFVMDADGSCQNEVRADRALGDRIGVGPHGTPCVFVVTQQSVSLVEDPGQLDRMIEAAKARTVAVVKLKDEAERRA